VSDVIWWFLSRDFFYNKRQCKWLCRGATANTTIDRLERINIDRGREGIIKHRDSMIFFLSGVGHYFKHECRQCVD